MFTGIIAATGSVSQLRRDGDNTDARLKVDCGQLDLADTSLGDSIAVSGCCLTVVELGADWFAADVSAETLRCTTLGELQIGSPVNLEKAMLATDRFGGHIVSGHVDGVGELLASTAEGDSVRLDFSAPEALSKYIAAKGSVCIDGTSLTVNSVRGNEFSINVIPHTQKETIIGHYVSGQKVNLEVDLVARYLERLNSAESESVIDEALLQKHGFTKPKQN
ncbi:MAG: riboflavin synthase [Gammaproteobacteria bacterium]